MIRLLNNDLSPHGDSPVSRFALDSWLSPYVGGVRPFRSVRFQGALLACRLTVPTTTIPKMKVCQAIGSGTLA